MNLDLDSRQRAMLAEMGVHVWWPASAAPQAALAPVLTVDPPVDSDAPNASVAVASRLDAVSAADQARQDPASARALAPSVAAEVTPPPTPAPAAPAEPLPQQRPAQTARRATVLGPAPTMVTPLAPGIAQMDWPALHASVATCQACRMCLGRRTPVLAATRADLRADWLVLGEPPDDAQERAAEPFVDDAGLLLDNMLKAVGVQRVVPAQAADAVPDAAAQPDPAHTAYLSLVLKCRPALPTTPDALALAACAHYLRREIALVQPKVILAMGRLAMQVLLSEDHPQGLRLPLGKLRGQVWHYQGVPVVVTYPPAYLLRNAPDKARAWADLCLAADVARGAARPG